MSLRSNLYRFILGGFVLVLSNCVWAGIIYVDDNATGANTGTCWPDAFTSLHIALEEANGETSEIRVAQGIYRPARAGGPQNTTFSLNTRCPVKGGYAGAGASDPDARDVILYETILSGDLNGNDVVLDNPLDYLGHPTRSDNTRHIVTIGSEDEDVAILDGFIIRDGHSDSVGGGVLVDYSNAILRNCTFQANVAQSSGGGLAFWNSRVILERCRFVNNAAQEKGGAVNLDGCGTCRSSFILFDSCELLDNATYGRGGAVCSESNTLCSYINCLIAGNISEEEGGAIYDSSYRTFGSSLILCTLVGNRQAAFYIDETTVRLRNCILWDNWTTLGTSPTNLQIDGDFEYLSVQYSCVEGSWIGSGNLSSNPNFMQAGFRNANGIWIHGDYHLGEGSPCLDRGDPMYIARNIGGTIPEGYYFPNPWAYVVFYREKDLDGLHRLMFDRVDVGAYESVQKKIWYVDDNASGANTGLNWTDAFISLQDALAAAQEGEHVHIGQGVYYPDRGNDVLQGDRQASFHLRNGITIKGGYAGNGAVNPYTRDIDLHKTIFSGDLLNNDEPLASWEWEDVHSYARDSSRDDNAYSVVTGNGTDETAVLDGVTITAGNANLYGVYGQQYDVPCCNNMYTEPGNNGGGMYNDHGNPSLNHCTFYRNTAISFGAKTGGGAVCNVNGGPVFRGCRFVENFSFSGDVTARGGAVLSINGKPGFVDCLFERNMTTGFDAEYYGGAMMQLGGEARMERCRFEQNQAVFSWAGALYLRDCQIEIIDSEFIGNEGTDGSGAIGSAAAHIEIKGSNFVDNVGPDGGAISASEGSLTIRDSQFLNNHASWHGGAIDNWFNEVVIHRCLFANNQCDIEGGAIHSFNNRLSLENATLVNNSAESRGGALASSHFAELDVANSIFRSNSAQDGNHLWVWDNTKVSIRFSNLEGGMNGISIDSADNLTWGDVNMDVDPLFADTTAGDYHLKSQAGRWDPATNTWVQDEVTSPCIDAGDPLSLIMHEPFPNGGIVNVGGYGGTVQASKTWFDKPICEKQIMGDLNGDCIVSLLDVSLMAMHWLEDRQQE
ncbi:MAG: hypothetical protein JXA82_04400 [Sedimentisphaerales bacterium]|nr:hypothetical protein [Sedimentisphaerales bacterium]